MLSDDFDPAATGVGVHVQLLAKELVEAGHAVTIICARHPGQAEAEVSGGLSIHRVPSRVADGHCLGVPSVRQLEEILSREKIELLHTHYFGFMAERGLRAARRLSLPHVYTFHMEAEHVTQSWPLSWLHPLIAWQYARMCRQYDQLIVPAAALKERLAKDPALKWIEAITNPVIPPKSLGPAREPSGDFTVLFVGRLSAEKNLPLLLRGFALFAKESPGARLQLVGTGREDAGLKQLAASLGLAQQIEFAGQRSHSELGGWYQAADVFVLPSTLETQGMVAVEAMFFSKPVLVSNAIVSANELVTDGENGFLISPSDPGDLGQRLRQLAADPSLRQRLGAAGAVRAQQYAPGGVARKVVEIYEQTLRRCSGPRPPAPC